MEQTTEKTRCRLDSTHREHLLRALKHYCDAGEADFDELYDLFQALRADGIDFVDDAIYQEKSRPAKGSPHGPGSGT